MGIFSMSSSTRIKLIEISENQIVLKITKQLEDGGHIMEESFIKNIYLKLGEDTYI